MSNRLTFSLASLVLIFALVFATMPAMPHDGHDAAPGHPTVDITEGTYTEANAKSRSNFRVKIVAKVDESTASNLFDAGDDLAIEDLTIKTYTADGTPGTVNRDQHVSQTTEVGNVSEKHELEISINLSASAYQNVRSIQVVVAANAVNGNRAGTEGGNERTTKDFDSLPSVLSLKAELKAAAKKDTSDVAIPGRYTLTVTFKDSDDAASTPEPTPKVSDIIVTPKGDAKPVTDAGLVITDMSTGLTAGATGVYTQDYQLTFGKEEATLGLISGYATNAPSTKIPPPVPVKQNPPAAMIKFSAHDTTARTFRVDVTFTPAADSEGDPGKAIKGKGIEVLKIVDKNDADAGASVLLPMALNEQKADNSYKAILQYSVFADPPLTVTIDQTELKTSNPTHSVVVGETAPTPTAPVKPAAPMAAIDATNDLVINVSWTAPDTGGSAITGYTVKQYEDTTLVKTFPETGQAAITATTLAVGPVSATDRGKSFTFTVTAMNAVGSSDESDKSAAVMIPAALATDLPAVTNVMATANTNGSVGVTWEWTGTADEMTALDGFTISVNPDYKVDAAARSFTIPAGDLTAGTAIEVAVKPRAKADSGFTTPTAGSKPSAGPVTPLEPPTNNAPAFATDASISPISARVNIATSTVFPVAGDADDGDVLTYSIKETLPAGLTFDATTRTLSGTPTAAAPTTAYTYVASDGTDEATLSFVITVAADNPPLALNPSDPRVAALIKSFDMHDGKFVAGMEFSARFPIVTDPDGDLVTYDLVVRQPAGATLADYYLMFDPTSRTLSANANPQGSGTSSTLTSHSPSVTEVTLAFIVSSLGLSVDVLTFTMQLEFANHAPAFASQDPIELTFTKGVAVKQGLPLASDEDSVLGDELTYSLSPALPSGLTLDTDKAEISGTPSSSMSKTGYQLTATDATIFSFKSQPVPVYITVVDPSGNNPPAFAVDASISDITATVGSPIVGITLPKATDADGDEISYTLTSSSTSLGLMGLQFNSETRRLSGTPNAAGTVTLTYTADDGNNGEDKLSFSVTVMPLKPATIEIPTATSSSAPIPLAPQFNPSIPAYGFAVLVRDVEGSGTYAPLPNTWKRSIDTPLPDLAWFFGTQPDARGGRTNGGTIALNGPGTKKDLVISEVMWGTDSSLAVPARSQWIEFYNATPNAIDLTGYTITFHRSQVHPSAWANAIDTVSNVSGHSVYFAPSELPGQSGRSNVLDSQGRYEQQRDLVSMYRQIDHVGVKHYNIGNRGERDKRITGWAASVYPTANIRPVHIATPGAEQISRVTIAKTTFSQDIIISEIGNSANDDYDWIELHNTTSEAIKLRKWDLTMIVKEGNVGKEKRLFQFPDDDTVWVPANGYLVIARTHPRNDGNDLAAGIDVTKSAIDQLKRGLGEKDLKNHPTAYYYVNSGLVLPNGNERRLYVLRNANDKHGQPTHVVDATGTLSIEVRGDLPSGFTGYAAHAMQLWNTATWPFQGAGKRHDNTIDGTGDEDFRAGRVYQRQGKNSGMGEKHLAIRGYTGVGYDRHAAVNAENGGTPGYSKDAVKGDKSNWANQVTISEIMLVTEEGEGAGRVPRATRLPQWFEIYNASLTEAVSINNWYLEIQNDDTPDFLTNLHGTLRLPNVIIQPNQTVLVVSNSGLNSGNFPDQRTINVFTNATYRQILGLSRRGEPMLNPNGFYIELRDHKGNSVDEIGNLGVSRRTGMDRRDNFGEQWEMPSLHSDEGHRTSLIRIYDKGIPRSGLNGVGGPKDASTSWTLASNTNFRQVPSLSYYGNHRDFGTPGYRGGGPLPVSLSKFRPERLESGEVVIRWVTESELNNAGFNILRSDTRSGEFTKVNTKLIAGYGTTSERNTYEWKDTSAKPNVVYYYQIQDVSIDGQTQTLRVSRLKGNVSPAGKAPTTWGELKALQ